MTDDVVAACEQSETSRYDERSSLRWTERGLQVATAAALGIDAYVHAHDASYYDFTGGGVISEGNLFRVEALVAAVAVLVLLVWRSTTAWLLAFLVAATALGAALLYRYVDVGALGPLPNMYEPTWAVPGKQLTAWAEAAAVASSAGGLALRCLWPDRRRSPAGSIHAESRD